MNEVEARYECEEKLLKKMEELYKIYKEYNPDGDYLGFTISDHYVMCNNKYWGKDANRPVHFIVNIDREENKDGENK